ncbi:MAG: serine protease, partial [Lachnospiraceae bacterium]|nr:serine protease [Lachnospiraceae bacterium]
MGNSEENRYHFENHSEAAPRQERVEWHHTGDGNDFTPRDRKPAKEKKHIGRKILTVAAVAALCCGSGAGGAFYASRYLVSKYPAVNTSVSSSGDAVVEKLSTTKAQEGGRISTDVTSVASNVMPAIVAINADVTEKVQTFMGTMEQKGTGSGSGIIVGKNDKELLIATNNHVVD